MWNSMKLIAIWEIRKFRNNRWVGIKFSWAIPMIEAKYWKCDKILTLRRTRDINKFLVIIPVIVVFQYKYWSPYTYKSSVGTGFETEIYFCKLTLRSKNYWCMSIQFRDIHINWFVFDTLISIDLSLSTTKIYVKLYTTKVNLLKFVNLVCF